MQKKIRECSVQTVITPPKQLKHTEFNSGGPLVVTWRIASLHVVISGLIRIADQLKAREMLYILDTLCGKENPI